MMSTSALRREWAPPCGPSSSRVTINLYGSGRISVRREAKDAFLALDACLRHHNYPTRAADTGAYNCRRITGGTGYSLHAYGIAADINWQSNPYGPRLKTDMPPDLRASIKALRTRSGAQVFRWGGDYTGNKDAMHYEVVCTQADLRTGIDASTLPAAPKPDPNAGRRWKPFAAPTSDPMLYAAGGRGDEVSELQILLNQLGFDAGKVDGVMTKTGPTTRAVVAFKKASDWKDASGAPDRSSYVPLRLIQALRNLRAAKG